MAPPIRRLVTLRNDLQQGALPVRAGYNVTSVGYRDSGGAYLLMYPGPVHNLCKTHEAVDYVRAAAQGGRCETFGVGGAVTS